MNPKEVFANEVNDAIYKFEQATGVEVFQIEMLRVNVSKTSDMYKKTKLYALAFQMK